MFLSLSYHSRLLLLFSFIFSELHLFLCFSFFFLFFFLLVFFCLPVFTLFSTFLSPFFYFTPLLPYHFLFFLPPSHSLNAIISFFLILPLFPVDFLPPYYIPPVFLPHSSLSFLPLLNRSFATSSHHCSPHTSLSLSFALYCLILFLPSPHSFSSLSLSCSILSLLYGLFSYFLTYDVSRTSISSLTFPFPSSSAASTIYGFCIFSKLLIFLLALVVVLAFSFTLILVLYFFICPYALLKKLCSFRSFVFFLYCFH